MTLPVLALDVGRTTLAAGLVAADGDVSHVRRIMAPQGQPAETTFSALLDLVDGVCHDARSPALQGIGAAAECAEFPLQQRLEERHRGLLVRVQAPAVCFTAAEHWLGAGRGADNLLGIVVADDVSSGLVLDGRLVTGGAGRTAGIGHVVVDPVGPVCSCGGIGCLQALAAGPNVVAWGREHGWVAAASAAGPELAASARAGDPVAAAALALAGTALGVAIASTAALLDLDLVVVGGELADSGDVLLGPLRRTVERHLCVPYARRLEILGAGVGPHVTLVGAAALVNSRIE